MNEAQHDFITQYINSFLYLEQAKFRTRMIVLNGSQWHSEWLAKETTKQKTL